MLAYNILRGFEVDAQLEMIRSGVDFPVPLVFLSEVDRGCARTDFRNIAREYAEGLGYYYVYATEFLELPGDRGPSGPYDPPVCEQHGNAIVSRYPLGNVLSKSGMRRIGVGTCHQGRQTPTSPVWEGASRFRPTRSIGTQLVRVYVLHLESTVSALDIRDAQAKILQRIAKVWAIRSSRAAISIRSSTFNDLQKGIVTVPAVTSFIDRAYVDAHQGLDLSSTATRLPTRSTWSST